MSAALLPLFSISWWPVIPDFTYEQSLKQQNSPKSRGLSGTHFRELKPETPLVGSC